MSERLWVVEVRENNRWVPMLSTEERCVSNSSKEAHELKDKIFQLEEAHAYLLLKKEDLRVVEYVRKEEK